MSVVKHWIMSTWPYSMQSLEMLIPYSLTTLLHIIRLYYSLNTVLFRAGKFSDCLCACTRRNWQGEAECSQHVVFSSCSSFRSSLIELVNMVF